MAWLSDSYDEIVDSLGGFAYAGGGGFGRFASTIIGKLTNSMFYQLFFGDCNILLSTSTSTKVHIFWEDHKILRSLPPKGQEISETIFLGINYPQKANNFWPSL